MNIFVASLVLNECLKNFHDVLQMWETEWINACYLYLFEHFRDWFAVELLACLSVGTQNLLHRHILGYRDKTTQRQGQRSYRDILHSICNSWLDAANSLSLNPAHLTLYVGNSNCSYDALKHSFRRQVLWQSTWVWTRKSLNNVSEWNGSVLTESLGRLRSACILWFLSALSRAFV